MVVDRDHPAAFTQRWPNLAQPRLGASVVFATDDFFGPKERLIGPDPPIARPGTFDDHGEWVDGWETRRKRAAGHDFCVVDLGRPALIYGVDIDTAFFTGNFPAAASLDASLRVDDGDDYSWTELVPATPLGGDARHQWAVAEQGPWQRLRLHIYPDGGVARLRVHGRFVFDRAAAGIEPIELSGLLQGGRSVAWSDAHYGWAGKCLLPDRGTNMGDGWETARRRTPGYEWQIIELGHLGTIRQVEIDTAHNKGNYPDRVSVQAARVEQISDAVIVAQSLFWRTLLPEQPLQPHHLHQYITEVIDLGPITHARLNLIPDGGISRVRLFGEPV